MFFVSSAVSAATQPNKNAFNIESTTIIRLLCTKAPEAWLVPKPSVHQVMPVNP